MIIQVPVSRLTFKMISYHYTPDKNGVIKITNRDFLSDLLSHRWSEKLSRIERMNQVCNLMISISVSKDLYHKLKHYTYEAGLHLHRYYRSMMLHYIWAQYQTDLPAIDAIRNFYDEYDLDDNDYDTESCYRSWLRYKKDMESKTVTRFREKKIIYKTSIATADQVDHILTMIVSHHLGLFFYETTQTWIDSLFRHVSTVVHYYHSGLSKKDYSEKYDIHLRQMDRCLEKWRHLTTQHPDIINTYRKACESVGLSLAYDTIAGYSQKV